MIVRKRLFTGSCLLLLVSVFMIIISFSPALASNGLPTVDKEWTCVSGFPSEHCFKRGCIAENQLMMWRNKPEYQLTFTATRAGNYSCEVTAIVNYFDHGTSPQTQEYTDIKLNGNPVGRTDDPCCPDTGSCPDGNGNGNGEEHRCKLGLGPTECNAFPECEYQYYSWYGVSTKGRCAGKNCAPYPHSCGGAGGCKVGQNNEGSSYWQTYFWTYFGSDQQCTGIHDNCCSCWTHGAWCGSCDPSRPADQVCRVKSPKYCGDIHYNERYCEQVIPGSGVQCEWDHSWYVMVDETRGRKPEHTSGVPCSQLTIKDELRPIEYTKYNGIIGVHHFGTDESDTDYICCFAKSGTLDEGMHCVRDQECKGYPNKQCIVEGTSTRCENSTTPNRRCTCGGAVSNDAPVMVSLTKVTSTCKENEDCVFRANATDANGDRIRYYFDWGDGTSELVPPGGNSFSSGNEKQKAHPYSTAGSYTVSVRAQEKKDGVFGLNSTYMTETFTVTNGGSACPNPNGICGTGETPENCPEDCEYYNICADVYFCDIDGDYGTIGVVEDQCQDDPDCGGCFPAGTEIRMADGSLKNIENIESGDRVLSFNMGLLAKGEVTYVHTPVKDRIYLLETENRELLVTGEHPLYVGESEFLRVSELGVGNKVYVLNGNVISEEIITRKEMLNDYSYVYNFEVEGGTYFADGFAVHNKEPPPPM